MMVLVWSPAFVRTVKRKTRRYPDLLEAIEKSLHRLEMDPFHPLLHTHKLTGHLSGTWACSVDYDVRILFEFVQNPESGAEEILLLTVGTHDEVY
ncbi:MAG: type II toxin-antitoxin system mRNA interferase toxin, RelE/StbE family [Anaerolineae bacterium]|nr:type II toxin-antitoxin system mRNA interferase toxin, RelE/StbE family [Anaerolineae bacterium]